MKTHFFIAGHLLCVERKVAEVQTACIDLAAVASGLEVQWQVAWKSDHTLEREIGRSGTRRAVEEACGIT